MAKQLMRINSKLQLENLCPQSKWNPWLAHTGFPRVWVRPPSLGVGKVSSSLPRRLRWTPGSTQTTSGWLLITLLSFPGFFQSYPCPSRSLVSRTPCRNHSLNIAKYRAGYSEGKETAEHWQGHRLQARHWSGFDSQPCHFPKRVTWGNCSRFLSPVLWISINYY